MTPEEYNQAIIEDLQAWGLSQEKRQFLAFLLDRDNQELSSGQAVLADGERQGMFWPQSELPKDKSLESAAILKASDGSTFLIQNCREDTGGLNMNRYRFDVARRIETQP